MPCYSVEGKLGTGKGKFCVFRAREGMRAGRKIAANFLLKFEHLTPELRASYTRLPHKPTPEDLDALGHGNPDSMDEDKNGLLFLDECATWLNARTYADKSRAAFVDWCVHARKKGWDVYFIVQNYSMIDKQLRGSMIEYEVRMRRLDRIRIPLIGSALGGLFGGRVGYFPRAHVATARLADTGAHPIVAERWIFRGDDLNDGYDTREVFSASDDFGPHSVLPPWDARLARTPLQKLMDCTRHRQRRQFARLSKTNARSW